MCSFFHKLGGFEQAAGGVQMSYTSSECGRRQLSPVDYELFVLNYGEKSGEEKTESTSETSPPEPENNTPAKSPPVPGNSVNQTPEDIPTVTIPDKNPPCPCCGTRVDRVLGLIKHLKRAHRKRRIRFQCATCGRKNRNYQ